jgi:putative oxidoreductase
MKKLLSTKYSAGAFNTAMLVLRLGVGTLMLMHGYDKLIHFAKYEPQFINLMGIGTTTSLALCIFGEFFCSLFLILGLFTRLASIPLIIVTLVIIFKASDGNPFGKAELPTLFLVGYIVLLLVGPGKVSVDSMIGK